LIVLATPDTKPSKVEGKICKQATTGKVPTYRDTGSTRMIVVKCVLKHLVMRPIVFLIHKLILNMGYTQTVACKTLMK
jgi:hypothetical protein